MTVKLFNQSVPFTDKNGKLTQVGSSFLNELVKPPGPASSVTVTGSPFTYDASTRGTLVVTGGTVSAIQLNRQGETYSFGVTSGLVPVGAEDAITITYTVAPTVTFIPG